MHITSSTTAGTIENAHLVPPEVVGKMRRMLLAFENTFVLVLPENQERGNMKTWKHGSTNAIKHVFGETEGSKEFMRGNSEELIDSKRETTCPAAKDFEKNV